MEYVWLAVVVGAIIAISVLHNKDDGLETRIKDLEDEVRDLKKVVTGGRKINPYYDPNWNPYYNRDGTKKNFADAEWDADRKPWSKYEEEK